MSHVHNYSVKMGKPQGRKKQHKGDKPLKEKYRLKRKTKDIDQIHEDLKRENAEKLLNQDVDLDKPGSAQFYCLHCAYVVATPSKYTVVTCLNNFTFFLLWTDQLFSTARSDS